MTSWETSVAMAICLFFDTVQALALNENSLSSVVFIEVGSTTSSGLLAVGFRARGWELTTEILSYFWLSM